MDASLRKAVQAVHTAFLGTAVDVEHQSYTQDELGTKSAAGAPVLRKAVVTRKEGLLPTTGPQQVSYRAVVSFVEPVAVGALDRIKLPDGLTGPLYIPQGGTLDPATGKPFATTVFIR